MKPVPIPPPWKYLKTNSAAWQLDKILSIESYAEVTKRNGDDDELDSLKIMPLNGIYKENILFTGSLGANVIPWELHAESKPPV